MAHSTNSVQIRSLQSQIEQIRNICILAHVDHGKTTLSDSLISSNGIVSERLAGTVRYLDSREDEQLRGITMKSSAISLWYNHEEKNDGTFQEIPYLINLIDSPGHVDFSVDVSTAVRLCDGALVLVDVVEGVCVQTHNVLEQAWLEGLKPILVLNKMDRLITELQLTPIEAYSHINRILEQLNVAASSFFLSEVLAAENELEAIAIESNESKDETDATGDWELKYDEAKEAECFFAPEKGNVVFSSAYDKWAFTVDQFASIISTKLGMKENVLRKVLWGPYYYSAKTKKVTQSSQNGKLQPMFVQFVLNSIWAVYESIVLNPSEEKMHKIISSLSLSIPPRDLRSKDPKVVLHSIMSRWLPLSRGIFTAVVQHVPNPRVAQHNRADKFWPHCQAFDCSEEAKRLKEAFMNCDASSDAPTILFISKLVSIEKNMLPDVAHTSHQTESASETEEFIGFARVFSGIIRTGQPVYVLGPKYSPTDPLTNRHYTAIEVNESGRSPLRVYIMMGRYMDPIDHVPAGNFVAIGALGDVISKYATISSSLACPAISPMRFLSAPIVRVAIEPENPMDLNKLQAGLRWLNQADPSVDVKVQENGELVVMATGELHLERCLKDLRDRFAKVAFQVSPPLVSFRETVSLEHTKIKPTKVLTSNRCCRISMRAMPLPRPILDFLFDNATQIREAVQEGPSSATCNSLKEKLLGVFEEVGQGWVEEIEHVWSFGPKSFGPNLLLNHLPNDSKNMSFWSRSVVTNFHEMGTQHEANADAEVEQKNEAGEQEIQEKQPQDASDSHQILNSDSNEGPLSFDNHTNKHSDCKEDEKDSEWSAQLKRFENSIVTGFQLACAGGPLCEEPLRGVCFVVEEVSIHCPQDKEGDIADVSDAVARALGLVKQSNTQNQKAPKEPRQHRKLKHNKRDESSDSNENDESDESDESDDEKERDGREQDIESNSTKEATDVASPQDRGELWMPNATEAVQYQSDVYGPFSGQLMAAVKECARASILSCSPRLVEAMFICSLQCIDSQLGKMYGVLSRRRGRIMKEELREGTQMFMIHAFLPVVESFGFAEELRKKTSGAAVSPQLIFSHWEVMDQDPFYVPTTEDELEEFGDNVLNETNAARQYINKIRRRKGLQVEEKIVVHAEKQRTLARKK